VEIRVNDELLEKLDILQRFKDFAIKFRFQFHLAFGSIGKLEMDGVVLNVFGVDDFRYHFFTPMVRFSAVEDPPGYDSSSSAAHPDAKNATQERGGAPFWGNGREPFRSLYPPLFSILHKLHGNGAVGALAQIFR
jgi:hypothetical protein